MRKRRLPRRWLRYLFIALGVLVGVLALSLIPASFARHHLVSARDDMEAGKRALLQGDPAAAERSFGQARAEFIEADAQARNPLLRVLGVLPLLGRTPDAVAAMADAGEDVAEAGVSVAGALADLPDGLGSLAPQQGRIPVERFQGLAPPMEHASGLVTVARRKLDATKGSWLLGPVAAARRQFVTQLDLLDVKARAAALMVARLPAFLGANGPRRYFFGAQNPSESRGTGGFLGAFAVLTADDGRLSLSSFRDIYDLPSVSESRTTPPNPDYARRYPSGFWPSVNLTGDFPSAATVIERLYALDEGTTLDGVIVADPFALQSLMKATNETVTIPAIDEPITAQNVVDVVSNDAAIAIADHDVRKHLLGDVAKVVLDRFLTGGVEPAEAARAITEAGSLGHLLLHSTDQGIEDAFAAAGVAGQLERTTGDYLKVIVNNGGANKVDYFADRSIAYRVALGAQGTATADVSIGIHNAAPEGVLAEPGIFTPPGLNISLLTTYLPGDAEVLSAESGGVPAKVGLDSELGHAVIDETLQVDRGDTGSAEYSVGLPHAWTGSSSRGVYRLTFQGQPTMRPVRLTIDVQSPPGTRIVSTNVPMQVSGNRAVWRGPAPIGREFVVEFQKPFLGRVWDSLSNFFGKRIVDF